MISGALHASLRPRNRVAASKQQQKFRPNSGADAILCLDDEGRQSTGPNEAREQAVRDQKETKSSQVTAQTPKDNPPHGKSSVKPVVPAPIATGPETKAAAAGSPKKEPVKIQLPGLLVDRKPNYTRNRRISKKLPSLPPPTPSPCRASFAVPPRPPKDIFHNNRDKVLRGQGSPVTPQGAGVGVAPCMSMNHDSSSGSSYDSAEHTWNMINDMMKAVNEDQVMQARQSLVHDPSPRRQSTGDHGPSAYVTFPRMRRPKVGVDIDEWASEESTLSDRTYRTSSTSSTLTSSTYRSIGELKDKKPPSNFANTFPRVRDSPPSLERQASVASAFSIVIQPTREFSDGAQDALIGEDDIPLRIKDILNGNYEPSLCSRTCSTTSTSSEGAELHPDLALTIGVLRDIELDEITFT